MSPVSRGRKKKPATSRPRRRLQPAQDETLASAEVLNTEKSVFIAEMWASAVLGNNWQTVKLDDRGDIDRVMAAFVQLFSAEYVKHGTATALAALRALSMVGDAKTRTVFRAAADKLAARGLPEPPWHRDATDAELFGAYSVREQFGDFEVIVLGFRRPGDDHALALHLDRTRGCHFRRTVAHAIPESGLLGLAKGMRPDVDPVELTPAQARAVLEEPLRLFLQDGPLKHVQLLKLDPRHSPSTSWHLLRTRLDAMPHTPPPSYDPLRTIEEFLASEHAESLPDKDSARSWAIAACASARGDGRAPFQWGPSSLETTLCANLPMLFTIDEGDLELLPDIVRAWAHYTADAAGLDASAHEVWDKKLPGILVRFAEFVRGDKLADIRKGMTELKDFRRGLT